ncbi:uncharacterized protein VTP21DRAFT_87 [Calcarisporiella thermophila]|uniref:uncharacterized protein n=1 Tax=Calcarisporiella thermophila TaxID=911321 RepID=UPI003744853B
MSEKKLLTLEDVQKHNTKDNLYIIIHNNVFDVTKFQEEHPGGEEVLLEEAGKDATEAFEDIGHSDEARELMQNFLVGSIEGAEPVKDDVAKKNKQPSYPSPREEKKEAQEGSSVRLLIPVAIGVIGFLAFKLLARR